MQNNAPIVVEFPPFLKGLADEVRAFVAAIRKVRTKNSAGGGAVDYPAVESLYAEHSARIERQAHEATLSSLDVDAARVQIRGQMHYSAGRFTADFKTQAGPVSVTRTLYRPAGIRNAPTVDPIALRIGVVGDYWLPGTAKTIAFLVQQGTSREAERTAREMSKLPYSRSSMERIGHAVGKIYLAEGVDIEDRLIEEVEIPKEATSMSVSVDRVSLPMEEPRPRPEGRPQRGAAKNPISRVYRMAYCATITLHDALGKGLLTLRYGWMPATDPESIADRLARDVMWLRMRAPHLKITLLADGAEEMWTILDRYINEEWQGARPTRLIDFWHVIEKLGEAAKVIFLDTTERTREMARWRRLLLRKSYAANAILEELKGSGLEWRKIGDEHPVHAAITYLENHADRMNYRSARRAGLPIASGNVEATCKSLVEVRMKRPGARWKEGTGQHVLTMRALGLSDLWDPAINATLATLRTSVTPVSKKSA